MKASSAEVLRKALKSQHSNETFEKSLARAVKDHGGTYADYIDLIGRVRGRVKREGGGLAAAAKALSLEGN